MERQTLEEIRSTDVQEILIQIPSRIIRWGITVFFISVLLLLFACWFIRYPEMIPARIIITNANPPSEILAKTSGKLTLFVTENQSVKGGEYLGFIENAAVYEDVLVLKKQIAEFKNALGRKEIKGYSFDENLRLGELQPDYSAFLKKYKDYELFEQLNYHTTQVSSLIQQSSHYRNLNDKLEAQKALSERELVLSSKRYGRDSVLFSEKMISQADLDQSEEVLLQYKKSVQGAKTSIINNNIRIAELENRILDLKLQHQETGRQLLNSIDQDFHLLQSQFAAWENKYVLKAPANGKITSMKYWSNTQFVHEKEALMTLVQPSSELFGMVQMPVAGSGKVKVGQKVKIRLDNYPHQEYGMLNGKVELISSVPRDNQYTIKVKLTEGLLTNYKKKLEFRQEMQGNADIVTDNLRLLERIFNQFRSLLKNIFEV